MTDATCYESHMRFPTDMKLLWESLRMALAYMPALQGAGHNASLATNTGMWRNPICPTEEKERGELQDKNA